MVFFSDVTRVLNGKHINEEIVDRRHLLRMKER